MDENRPDGSIDAIADQCLGVRLRALSRAVTALYDDALRPHGVRIGQMNLLVAIAKLGKARPADLCRILCMDKSTLSRDVEVLRRRGWLEVDDSGGGRARPLRITAAGYSMIQETRPAWQSAQARARVLLGEEGSEAIIRVVAALWAKEGGRP